MRYIKLFEKIDFDDFDYEEDEEEELEDEFVSWEDLEVGKKYKMIFSNLHNQFSNIIYTLDGKNNTDLYFSEHHITRGFYDEGNVKFVKYSGINENIDFEEDWEEEDPDGLKVGDKVKINKNSKYRGNYKKSSWSKTHPFNDEKAIITEVSDKDGYQVVKLKRVGVKKEEYPWWKADTLKKITLNESIQLIESEGIDFDDFEWMEEDTSVDITKGKYFWVVEKMPNYKGDNEHINKIIRHARINYDEQGYQKIFVSYELDDYGRNMVGYMCMIVDDGSKGGGYNYYIDSGFTYLGELSEWIKNNI